eukprot:TRINITY_DN1109_c0_g1_i2.p1 TRINITY_DN1109_c0_g1~~TRINITY_DN1109_c0_g1_i2.p1  ORF type:complete len:257 (+),score=28.13 TRINITY_DN1109_c0_g1_i2:192-962(+)
MDPFEWLFASSDGFIYDAAWIMRMAYVHSSRKYRPVSHIYNLFFLFVICFAGSTITRIICNDPVTWMGEDALVWWVVISWFIFYYVPGAHKLFSNPIIQHIITFLDTICWLRTIMWAMSKYHTINPSSYTGPIIMGAIAGGAGGIIDTSEAKMWFWSLNRNKEVDIEKEQKIPNWSSFGIKVSFCSAIFFSLAIHGAVDLNLARTLLGLMLLFWSFASLNGFTIDPAYPFEISVKMLTDTLGTTRKTQKEFSKKGV